jgi:hypothetical protein
MDPVEFRNLLGPIIALFALGFTVGTFWWNNWRRGNLEVDRPRTFAAFQNKATKLRLLLPLVLSNTGARSLVVTALRLVSVDRKCTIPCVSVRTNIDPLQGSRSFITNFVIGGRDSVLKICEFEAQGIEVLTAGPNEFRAEVLLADSGVWSDIGSFEVFIEEARLAQLESDYVVYDNARSMPS